MQLAFSLNMKICRNRWEKDGHVSRECWRKAGHLGLLGLDIPMDDYPGDFLDSVVSIEEQ